jgi:hypothetical protein
MTSSMTVTVFLIVKFKFLKASRNVSYLKVENFLQALLITKLKCNLLKTLRGIDGFQDNQV